MLKVMIVDDESVFRLALKSLASWDDLELDIALEAENGREALNLFKENPDIDIMITDINMPIMDGFDLISHMKEISPKTRIIVLSAYDDYSLVRQAFKLGAHDYLLKTDLNTDSIRRIIPTVENHVKENVERDKDYRYTLKEVFLKELLLEKEVPDPELRVEELDVRLAGDSFVACFIWIDDYQVLHEKYTGNELTSFSKLVVNSLYQVLMNERNGEAICISPQEYALLFSFEDDVQLVIHQELNRVLTQVKYYLENYLNVKASIGVSSLMDGLEGFHEAYKQAEKNAQFRLILGKDQIIFTENVIGYLPNEDSSGKAIDYTGFMKSLRDFNRELAFSEIEKVFREIRHASLNEAGEIYTYYFDLLFRIANWLDEQQEDKTTVLGREISFYDKIKSFETVQEIEDWVREIVRILLNYMSDKKNTKINRDVVRGQEFIQLNYHEDLTLKMVSDYAGLSESHFSRIFTKYTGLCFSDYLTELRINKAKELMSDTNLKIYEIAEKIGYSNIYHFSRMFKKVTGVSPNQFKHRT